MKCEVCGSDRILVGPAHSPDETTCMDCGSQFNRTVRRVPTTEEVQSQISDSIPFPTGGFSSPEEAAAHLAKLKAAAAKLGKSVEEKVDRPAKKVKSIPDSKLELKDEFPTELVFMAVHAYQRNGESWQAVLATAKGEREFRNENVRVFGHNHIFGAACTPTCKEI